MSDGLGPLQERLATGMPGLDRILHGGFLEGSAYLIHGAPGMGKTVLANQICFQHVQAGGVAVYITLMTETHARLLGHMRAFTFFDPGPLTTTLSYFNGYQVFKDEGFPGLLQLIREQLRERRVSLLVLDGLDTIEDHAEAEVEIKRFIQELQVLLEATRCTALLLSLTDEDHPLYRAETRAVDGHLTLSKQLLGPAALREIEVHKLRGSAFLEGRHSYTITNDGMVIYPRFESLFEHTLPELPADADRVPFGIPILDTMLKGGLIPRTTNVAFGVAGAGKTLLGLHFLNAGAARGEQGLYVGFYEPPAQLLAGAERCTFNFAAAVAAGTVDLLWYPPIGLNIDCISALILEQVEARGVRRLVIDGLNVFTHGTRYPERLPGFLSALTNILRARDVTTVLTLNMGQLFGGEVDVPVEGLADMADTLLFLRYVELESQLQRFLSILKMRGDRYDPAIRAFEITADGIEVATTLAQVESILTGIARAKPGTGAAQ